MKSINLLAVALLVLASTQIQAKVKEAPLTDEERVVAQVFEAPGHTKDQVFSAARMWVAENFKSADAVIEYENRDEGVLMGKGTVTYPCTGGFTCRIRAESWRVGFTVKVESKDDRFRLTFTNVHMAYPAFHSRGISLPARDEPVKSREDMSNIRAKLLGFGGEIASSIGKASASSDW